MTSGDRSNGDISFQIAPMIDLVLVLMVFFMSIVALKPLEKEISIQTPSGKPFLSNVYLEPLTVTIDSEGFILSNAEIVGSPDDKELLEFRVKLRDQLNFFGQTVPILILPEKETVHARIIDVLNVCASVGIKNISFGTS